jgi:hypothetical protein
VPFPGYAPLGRPAPGCGRRTSATARLGHRLVLGPRGGVITTATLRDATGWDALVTELAQPGLVHTAYGTLP